MWSFGVIVFMLLSGYPPFYGKTEEKMILLIESGRYTMRSDRWDAISSDGKDFVRRCLEMDEYKRMTAEEGLRHRWMIEFRKKRGDGSAYASAPHFTSDVVQGLRNYAMASHLKRAVLCSIAYSLDSSELNELRELFISLDIKKSGTISMVDFKSHFKKFCTNDEMKRIFNHVDHDHHGHIEYSEFVAAMLETTVGLDDNMIQDAFEKFDHEHKGYLTAANLEEVLGETFEDTRVADFIQEVHLKQSKSGTNVNARELTAGGGGA